ncbi:MAG: heme ABC transporter ATP-binding protein [Tabrizicola sp.]|jgi:iron complex transport system ATP-binding protein|nr:heme ABC transporter ATP-binding protein [Tabrizicola sp.]
MLKANGITLDLAGMSVLSDVALSAYGGEVLAICGPNGAGKSSLLRVLAGEGIGRGTVLLNGEDVGQSGPEVLARRRAVLAQDTQVAFAFTVAEIVAMGQEAGDHSATHGVVESALAAVGLTHLANRPVLSLSGGERQRAQLARALAQVWAPTGPDGPRWLFLDEPVASLDLGHQLEIMQLARGFADAGGGVVAVMHDLNLSAMFADRMVLLVGGKLIAEGPPEAVMQAEILERAYGCRVTLNCAPKRGPWLLPQSCTPRTAGLTG